MTPCHWTSCLLSILLPLPTHKAAHSGCWWQTVCVVVGPPCLCPSVGAYFPGWPWLALDYSRVWPVLTLGPHSAAPGVWPAASAGPRTRVTRGHRRRRPGAQGGRVRGHHQTLASNTISVSSDTEWGPRLTAPGSVYGQGLSPLWHIPPQLPPDSRPASLLTLRSQSQSSCVPWPEHWLTLTFLISSCQEDEGVEIGSAKETPVLQISKSPYWWCSLVTKLIVTKSCDCGFGKSNGFKLTAFT